MKNRFILNKGCLEICNVSDLFDFNVIRFYPSSILLNLILFYSRNKTEFRSVWHWILLAKFVLLSFVVYTVL